MSSTILLVFQDFTNLSFLDITTSLQHKQQRLIDLKHPPKSPKSPKYGVDLGLGGGVTEEIVNSDCDPERIHEIALDIGCGGVGERGKQDGEEGKSDGFDGRDSDSAKQRYLNPARDGAGTPQ